MIVREYLAGRCTPEIKRIWATYNKYPEGSIVYDLKTKWKGRYTVPTFPGVRDGGRVGPIPTVTRFHVENIDVDIHSLLRAGWHVKVYGNFSHEGESGDYIVIEELQRDPGYYHIWFKNTRVGKILPKDLPSFAVEN